MKLFLEMTNSVARDMKYEALYWALGFMTSDDGLFHKHYACGEVCIDIDKQIAVFPRQMTIIGNHCLPLDDHKSFVILECIDRLFTMGYQPVEIILDLDNEYDIYCQNLYIRCFAWGDRTDNKDKLKPGTYLSINYCSRLVSGNIELEYQVNDGYQVYSKGIFENETRKDQYMLYDDEIIINNNFQIEGSKLIRYFGHDHVVTIPNGITELSSCLFWDNQEIEEVILPDTLIMLGGDTFYNCSNLRKVTIPKSVKTMCNNPFAGCPKLVLENHSPYFHYEEGTLYNHDYTRLIYHSIMNESEIYRIKEGTKIIGKHSFYLCTNLESIVIPESVIKMENNPFSGCNHLELDNHSNKYHVINKVIYDEKKESVIGCLNSADTDELRLLPVKRICRNSFWNCKGIRKIVLPKTLETIGYNPFVGCSNIEFVSESPNYIVYKNALYTNDKRRLVCYPSQFTKGEIYLPDETTVLERGAFSGSDKMTAIHLHNVAVISKACFSNCASLKELYCSDFVGFIGEWAFSHCKNLKKLSVFHDCVIENNAFLNSPTGVEIRKERSNYVIESDNLYILEGLDTTMKGKVKSILIDPPYNSNIDYIGYKDSSFKDGYIEFMRKRIAIAYRLLTDDGFLVINIDKGEVRNLKNLCKEYFGRLVKVHKWEKLHPFFDKNRKVMPRKKKVKYEYIIICKKTEKSVFQSIMKPYIDDGELCERENVVPKVFRCFGTTSSAKDEISEIFGDRNCFTTPKPLKLMKELVRATTDKNSIVIDFFAGSGTVGEAVVSLNEEDCGNRKYILVSNSESNICQDVTLKRIQRIDQDVKFIQ